MVNSVLADHPSVSFADSLKRVRLPMAIGYGNHFATLQREPWCGALSICLPFFSCAWHQSPFEGGIKGGCVQALLRWYHVGGAGRQPSGASRHVENGAIATDHRIWKSPRYPLHKAALAQCVFWGSAHGWGDYVLGVLFGGLHNYIMVNYDVAL